MNHKDGDKTNNWVVNLEWSTDEENKLHALQTGLRKIALNPEEVCFIRKNYRRGGRWIAGNSAELAAQFGVSVHLVRNVVSGRRYGWVTDCGEIPSGNE